MSINVSNSRKDWFFENTKKKQQKNPKENNDKRKHNTDENKRLEFIEFVHEQ